MYKRFLVLFAAALVLCGEAAGASGALFFLEAQGVGGYSSVYKRGILYSQSAEDVMQKPSLGFDYLQRISGDSGDVAALALQARLAYDPAKTYLVEPQVYNAFVKFKPAIADIWIGHNRPALGLSSYFDSHALLLPAVAMYGFGYDRDWGAGMSRDFGWGSISLSGTLGSGMPLLVRDNYLAAARVSLGTLSQDNYTVGISGCYGSALQTMGYHVMEHKARVLALGGIDAALLWDNYELRAEVLAGKRYGKTAAAFFLRAGVNLLEEGSLKLEIQPVYWFAGRDSSFVPGAGLSWLVTGDVAFRTLYTYDSAAKEHRAVLQMYYYGRPWG